MTSPAAFDGILIVDKPKDWTSHDVCAFVRKRFKIKKVGHAGTLDPLATGVLVLLLGKATKLSQKLSACDKEYSGVMKLGVETDTHDITGQVTQEKPWEALTLEQIESKSETFLGNITQIPPMVSALKHKGVPLYKLARQGKTVPRDPRDVTVHSWNIEKKEGDLVWFSTHVSKGTYVRTLVHDLGQSLDSCAALMELRRTRSGESKLENGVTIEELKEWTPEQLSTRLTPLYSMAYANLPSA